MENNKLEQLRHRIDECDRQIVALLDERMDIAKDVAEYKINVNKPVYDPARERALLKKISELSRYGDLLKTVYQGILSASRSLQSGIISQGSVTTDKINAALDNTSKVFPKNASVAVAGVEGAYASDAAQKLFSSPDISFCPSFDEVFEAVAKGRVKYGVLPIENSRAGSVGKVYDLLCEYGFYIVRSVNLKIDHCLLAKRGTRLSDIKKICSHEQALAQCSEFLSSLDGVELCPFSNTAAAAEHAAAMGSEVAAISSVSCASLYGLEVLGRSIQDTDNNHTRFVCISKELEIYPDANRTTLIFDAENKPGGLYFALSEFYARDINLVKLESRPIVGSDFEVRFILDIQESVFSDALFSALAALESRTAIRYLGSYGSY